MSSSFPSCDPFAFICELCYISPSQQDKLSRCSFARPTIRPPRRNDALSSSGSIAVPSTGIGMVSLPETQDGGKDTLPEGSSLPTSDDQLRSMAFHRCTTNRKVNVDDENKGFVDLCGYAEGTGYVDLGRDSNLGFSEFESKRMIDCELVAECPRVFHGDDVSEISNCEINEFQFFERELDGLGELPLKKMKLSEENIGFDSSKSCLGIQFQNDGGMVNCKGELVANMENPCNFGADSQSQTARSAENCNFEADSQSETATNKQPVLRLQSSVHEYSENAAKEYGKDCQERDFIFSGLKVIEENSDKDSLENIDVLEAAKIRGFTFPRPRWWPDNKKW